VIRSDAALIDTPPQGDAPPAAQADGQHGGVDTPEAVHVPVKKKGTRKR
jgi:hypothetical protein